MAKKVSGLTVAINADTSGVTSGLKDITAQSIALSQQLKTVDKLLDMDPGNADVIATRQRLLADSLETTKKKLEALRGAQEDVERAFERGEIDSSEYVAFQKELVQTEARLRDLQEQSDDTGNDLDKLGDDIDEETEETKEAEEETEKFGDKLKNGLAAGAEAAAASIAAVTAATAAAIVEFASDVAEYGDEIDKTSQKMGMSAEAYQEWDAIMQHSGTDISQMTSGMKRLAEAVEAPTDKTTEAFKKIGISIEDAARMSQEDLFAATIEGLQKMESGTERTATASALLGRGAMELGALLNTSAEDTEAMRQKVHDLGGVMSDDAVKASAAFQDSLQDMQTAFAGVKRGVAGTFMPSMTQMMDGIGWLVSGHEEGMADIEEGLDSFLENLGDMADKAAEMASKLLPAIAEGITKNLPKLVQPAIKIVASLGKTIVQNLPLLVTAAKDIIISLAQDLSKALPELVPSIVGIVLDIVDTLTDPVTLSELIDASIAIIMALADGIIGALPQLIERLPELVEKIVDGIIDNLDKLLDAAEQLVRKFAEYLFNPENVDKFLTAGMDIITKIVKGIGDALYKIGLKCKEIAKEIADKLGIGEYWEIGQKVIDDFMGGVLEKWHEWEHWWEGFGEYIYDALHPGGDEEVDWDNYIGNAVSGEPGAATGAYITRPTRLLTGEGGRKEVVLPLEQNTGWADILADKLAAAGGGGGVQIQSITINAAAGADGRQLANDFVTQLDTRLRQMQIQQVRGIGGTAW